MTIFFNIQIGDILGKKRNKVSFRSVFVEYPLK